MGAAVLVAAGACVAALCRGGAKVFATSWQPYGQLAILCVLAIHGMGVPFLAVANAMMLMSDETPKSLQTLAKERRWGTVLRRLCRLRSRALREVCCEAGCRLRPCNAWVPLSMPPTRTDGLAWAAEAPQNVAAL